MKKSLIIFCPWGKVTETSTLSSMPCFLLPCLKKDFELIIIDPSNMDSFSLSFFERMIILILRYFSKTIFKVSNNKRFQFEGVRIENSFYWGKLLEKVANKYPNSVVLTFGNSTTRFYKGVLPVFQFIDGIYTVKIDYYIDRNKLSKWENYNILKTDLMGIRRSKAILCTSETIKVYIEGFLLEKNAIRETPVINVGTGANTPELLDFSYSEPNNEIGICFVYSNFERKNGDLVLKIARLLEGENYKFHFIGRKPEKIPINHKNIVYHGFIDKNRNPEEFLNVIRKCKINLLPSKGDLTPHIICECNSLGIPSLANDVGGIKDLIGDGGILVHSIEEGIYCDAIRQISNELPERSQLSFEKYYKEQRWSVVAQKIGNQIKLLSN